MIKATISREYTAHGIESIITEEKYFGSCADLSAYLNMIEHHQDVVSVSYESFRDTEEHWNLKESGRAYERLNACTEAVMPLKDLPKGASFRFYDGGFKYVKLGYNRSTRKYICADSACYYSAHCIDREYGKAEADGSTLVICLAEYY